MPIGLSTLAPKAEKVAAESSPRVPQNRYHAIKSHTPARPCCTFLAGTDESQRRTWFLAHNAESVRIKRRFRVNSKRLFYIESIVVSSQSDFSTRILSRGGIVTASGPYFRRSFLERVGSAADCDAYYRFHHFLSLPDYFRCATTALSQFDNRRSCWLSMG